MRADHNDQPGLTGFVAKRPVLSAVMYYAVSASLLVPVTYIFDMSAVKFAFVRWAWRMTEWHSFPLPYDYADFASSQLPPGFIRLLPAIIVTTLLTITAGVATLHVVSFSLVVLAHKWFGWPRYWKEVRSKLDLRAVLARSAKRSWWVWPVTQSVWLLLTKIGSAFQYVFCPVIDCHFPFLVANILATCLIYCWIAGRNLQTCLCDAVSPDLLRCGGCGYLLRGLTGNRCPECGVEQDPNERRYGLLSSRGRTKKRAARRLVGVAIVALLLAPAWLPSALANLLPTRWLHYVPDAIRPDWSIISPNRHAFPIRLDSVCTVEHDNSVAVIRFTQEVILRANYRVCFWLDKGEMKRNQPPATISTGRLTNGGGPNLPIGPWTFMYGMAGENMIWLTRPDSTYDVSAYTEAAMPGGLREVLDAWGKDVP